MLIIMMGKIGKQPYSCHYRLVADCDTKLDHNYGVRILPQLHLAVGKFTFACAHMESDMLDCVLTVLSFDSLC